jgi:hypothetical protein
MHAAYQLVVISVILGPQCITMTTTAAAIHHHTSIANRVPPLPLITHCAPSPPPPRHRIELRSSRLRALNLGFQFPEDFGSYVETLVQEPWLPLVGRPPKN